jgi:hypothetical protein
MEENGVFAFRTVPGNEAWNKGVEGTKQMFRDLLSSNDAITQSRAFAQAASLPVYQLALKVADARIKELQKQLTLHAGAGASVHTPSGVVATAPVDIGKMTVEQRAAYGVEQARKKRGA